MSDETFNAGFDPAALGPMAMRVMETVSERFSEGTSVRTAAVVLEVDLGPATAFVFECSDDRSWVLESFLFEAAEAVVRGRQELEQPSE